jgi:hypothetical protein
MERLSRDGRKNEKRASQLVAKKLFNTSNEAETILK